LPGLFAKLGLNGCVLGIEETVEMCNVGTFQGEVKYPGKPTWDLLRAALPRVELKDATGLIMRLREIKSCEEVDAIRLAIETAGFGMQAARLAAKPGMKEVELAAVVEAAIHGQGTGYKGIRQARGYACVYSGARSFIQWTHYAYSSDRVMQEGEPVIIELGSFADGYWSDLTRNLYLGSPPKQVLDYYEVIRAAQQVAIGMMKPGVPFSSVDRAVVQHLEKYGCLQYRTHGLGHGVGFAYHEGPPVHSANHALIEAGMVLTVEPGIYIEGLGGFRPEDMVWIREDGAELLSGIVPSGL
jgi:Xaa-Pro aminopeptidase